MERVFPPRSVLCVCLGNICRSPLAEALLKKHAILAGLRIRIESAGTNRYHKGGPADERTERVALQNGIDLSRHRARRLTAEDFEQYDWIFTLARDVTEEMEEFHEGNPQYQGKIVNFLDSLSDEKGRSVPDPWYGDEEDFEECFDLIDRAARSWVELWSTSG